jgi:hypothetical protein
MKRTIVLHLTAQEVRSAIYEFCADTTGLLNEQMVLTCMRVNGQDTDLDMNVEVEFMDHVAANQLPPPKKSET